MCFPWAQQTLCPPEGIGAHVILRLRSQQPERLHAGPGDGEGGEAALGPLLPTQPSHHVGVARYGLLEQVQAGHRRQRPLSGSNTPRPILAHIPGESVAPCQGPPLDFGKRTRFWGAMAGPIHSADRGATHTHRRVIRWSFSMDFDPGFRIGRRLVFGARHA